MNAARLLGRSLGASRLLNRPLRVRPLTSRRSKLAATFLVALIAAGGALAYYLSSGSGVGSASVGGFTPAVISAPSTSGASITITWTAQASLSDSSLNSGISYTVQRKLGSGGTYSTLGSGGCGGSRPYNTASCTDTVTANGTYYYEVVAHYGGNAWSATSNEVSTTATVDTTPPTTAITFPGSGVHNAANYNAGCSPTGICGTANDATGVAVVRVSVLQATSGKYWDSGDSSFDLTSETFTNATLASPGATSTTWDLPLPLPSDSGYTVHVQAKDTVGNDSAPTTTSTGTFSIDSTAPTALISLEAGSDTGSSNSDNITKASSLVFDISFSESVSGLTAGSFSSVGTATGCSFGSLTGSGSSYTITASGCSEGTVKVRLAASAASDTAGNPNAQTDGATVTIDRTAPTVQIALQSSSDTGSSNSDNITNASSLVFNVTFSENVSSLTAGSFSKGSGTATGCSFGSLSGSGSSYTITASGCSEGTLVVRLAASAVSDTAGNPNAQTDGATVTIDRTAPTVQIALQAASDTGSSNSDNITKASSLVFDISFSESVSGLTAGSFSNVGTATGCSFGSLSGSGSSYTITATGCSEGTVKVRLAASAASDTAGNPNAQTDGATVTIDRTAPTVNVTIATGQATSTASQPINFTATFSEPVNALPGNGTGITLGGTANNSHATIAVTQTSSSVYNIAVSGLTTTGTVTASVNAGATSDLAGNTNPPGGPSSAVTLSATTVTQNSWTSGGYILTVPAHVTSFTFALNGAGGGGSKSGAGGGAGGSVSGTVTLPDSTTTTTIHVFVGQGGGGVANTGSSGGAGGSADSAGCGSGGPGGDKADGQNNGAGGGGATCFYITAGSPIAVAGGGGGGSGATGGTGGGGGSNGSGSNGSPSGTGGGGGTGSGGGTGVVGTGCVIGSGTSNGSNTSGGTGAKSSGSKGDGGGGGGGGYYGGGGGGCDTSNTGGAGGGGGGSGFTSGMVSGVTTGTGSAGGSGSTGANGTDGTVSFTGVGLVDPPADPGSTDTTTADTTTTTTTDTTTSDTTTTDTTTTDTTTADTTTTDTTTTGTCTTDPSSTSTTSTDTTSTDTSATADTTATDTTAADTTSTDTTTTTDTTCAGGTQTSGTSMAGLSTGRELLFFGVLGGSVLGMVALLTMPIPRRRRARRRRLG